MLFDECVLTILYSYYRSTRTTVKKRDEMSKNNELKEIPVEIRAKEAQIDMLKREIENDNTALSELRKNSDAQNSITVLKEQVKSDMEALKDSLSDEQYRVKDTFNLDSPTLPAADEDKTGDELVERMQTFSTSVENKYESMLDDLGKAKKDLVEKQRVASEKSALATHSKQTLASLREKLAELGGDNGSVNKFNRTVIAIRDYEQSNNIKPTLQTGEHDPQVVLAHLSTRLDTIGKDASAVIQPEQLSQVLEQIYLMVSPLEHCFLCFRPKCTS